MEKEKEAASEVPEALTEQERYSRLMELLGKSKIYSDYLMNKFEQGDEASALAKKQANERKSLKQKANSAANKRGRTKSNDSEPKSKKLKPDLKRTFQDQEISDDQPLLLSGAVMRDYQIQGYQWVARLFENDINGILADEMGLGKTIQTIAMFCHLVEMGIPGPFLIVAPLSTVPNWMKEFKK